MREREDPGAIAQLVADTIAAALAPYAGQLGRRRNNGVAALRWFLDLGGDPEGPRWLAGAADGHHASVGSNQ